MGIILFAYAACRLLFLAFNASLLPGHEVVEILSLFFYGLRFDIFAILVTNTVFIIGHTFPFKNFYHNYFQKTLKALFYIFNIPALLFNLIDCIYFHYTRKRTTADFFTAQMATDLKFNITTYIFDFWYILVILVVLLYAINILYRKTYDIGKANSFRPVLNTVLFVVSCGIYIIGVRGGFQYKPVSMQSAARYTSQALIPAMVNTPFSIIKTQGKEALTDLNFMTASIAEKEFPVYQNLGYDSIIRKNVVIIIMESFSKEYCGFFNKGSGFTPFLDSLCYKSLVFTNAYANSKRSIEGIPAIVASLPHLMDEAFISSAYNTNGINGIAGLLKKQGYSGYFFHGGHNGTMGFENFSPLAGFSKYFGKNEYNGSANDYDGNWGIYDEPFFRFMSGKLNTFPQPFIATFFSLSSHHPYNIPDQYANRFPKGSHPVFESVGYADYSLRKFFNEAQNASWFNNTLFVITADHTGQPFKPEAITSKGSFEVPILFYCPSDSTLQGINDEVMQHADILPTILDYLHFPGDFSAFGHSMLRPGKRLALTYINNIYQGITNDRLLLMDGNTGSVIGMFDYRTDPLLKIKRMPEKSKQDDEIIHLTRAALQQFRTHLIKNDLVQQ